MTGYSATGTILDQILERKLQLVARMRTRYDALRELAESAPQPRGMKAALRQANVTLIAECKKASPSKGVLLERYNAPSIARLYAANGASAISVLTDEPFFQGSVADLEAVRGTVSLPVLRKDFIIDETQILEARAAGADAILLIVMALEDARLSDLLAMAHALGLDVLVETHDANEVARALTCGASIIGVNNRDLRTFSEDLSLTERLAAQVPPDIILVAESAIRTTADVARMGAAGVDAILVGEGLLKAADPAAQVRAFSSQPRQARS